MATTQLDICNRAIQKLGGKKLTDLLGTDIYTVAALRAYDDVIEAELRSHNWNFAMKRTSIAAVTNTITGITAAEPPVVTTSGTLPTDGDRVYISGVAGMTEVNSKYYRVANASGTTFELTDETSGDDIDGSGYTAYTSGGSFIVVPYYGYDRRYAIPSDMLRLVELNGHVGITTNLGDIGQSSDFTMEGGYILTNDTGPIFIRYVATSTTVSDWDSMFKEVVVCKMALEMSTEIKQDDANVSKLAQDYNRALGLAKMADSIETPAGVMPASDWLLARY